MGAKKKKSQKCQAEMKDTEHEACEEPGRVIRKEVPDMVRSGLNRKLLRNERLTCLARVTRLHWAEAASPRSKEYFAARGLM